MTTTSTDTTSATGTATVSRFLDAICDGGGIPADLFAPDALLDATVPNWRFPARQANAIAEQLSEWFADPATFEELERVPIGGGEVVTFLLTWVERGVPHAAHQCHVVQFDDDGLIASDQVFCGGRWDAGMLAEMPAATDAG